MQQQKAAQLLSRLFLEDKSHAKEVLTACVHLLLSVSPRILKRFDQQYNLSQVADLTSLAVSVCLELDDDPYDALSILEIGRGVIINQQLELRSDISDLKAKYSKVAARFETY